MKKHIMVFVVSILMLLLASLYGSAEESVDTLLQQAESGDVSAMLKLADAYRTGYGVDENAQEAFSWTEKAANAGDPAAMSYVGFYYDKGYGVMKDPAAAFQWYKKSAEAGYATAMIAVGDCFINGTGTEIDAQEAISWYQKAIAAGNSYGYLSLGTIYEHGTAVDADPEKALAMYLKGAEAGNPDALFRMGEVYYQGELAAQDFQEAYKWYLSAAEAGNSYAMNRLGLLYNHGLLGEADLEKALEWYKKSAQNGNVYGAVNYADLLASGKLGEPDYDSAIEYNTFAANAGNTTAMVRLGMIYEENDFEGKDYQKAKEWYEKACDAGNSVGALHLGYMMEEGRDEEPDYAAALEYFLKAVELDTNNSAAMNHLATSYYFGRGTEIDYEKAFEWALKSAEVGDEAGIGNVAFLYENGIGTKQDFEKASYWYAKIGKPPVNALTFGKAVYSKDTIIQGNMDQYEPIAIPEAGLVFYKPVDMLENEYKIEGSVAAYKLGSTQIYIMPKTSSLTDIAIFENGWALPRETTHNVIVNGMRTQYSITAFQISNSDNVTYYLSPTFMLNDYETAQVTVSASSIDEASNYISLFESIPQEASSSFDFHWPRDQSLCLIPDRQEKYYSPLTSQGKGDPYSGAAVAGRLGKAVDVENTSDGWFSLTAPIDGDYYLAILAPDITEGMLLRISQENASGTLKEIAQIPFKPSSAIQSYVLNDLVKGQTVFFRFMQASKPDSTSKDTFIMKISLCPENYEDALNDAESGNTERMVDAGYCCYYGLGTSSQPDVAKEWLQKAADNGSEDAIRYLAQLNGDVPEAVHGAAFTTQTSKGSVKVYEDASSHSKVVTTLRKGRDITVDGEDGDWYHIKVDLGNTVKEGYITKDAVIIP